MIFTATRDLSSFADSSCFAFSHVSLSAAQSTASARPSISLPFNFCNAFSAFFLPRKITMPNPRSRPLEVLGRMTSLTLPKLRNSCVNFSTSSMLHGKFRTMSFGGGCLSGTGFGALGIPECSSSPRWRTWANSTLIFRPLSPKNHLNDKLP